MGWKSTSPLRAEGPLPSPIRKVLVKDDAMQHRVGNWLNCKRIPQASTEQTLDTVRDNVSPKRASVYMDIAARAGSAKSRCPCMRDGSDCEQISAVELGEEASENKGPPCSTVPRVAKSLYDMHETRRELSFSTLGLQEIKAT